MTSSDPIRSAGAKPRRSQAERIAALCRHIDERIAAGDDAALDLEALGAHAHLSSFHLQRQFKAVTGVTPRQYVAAARLARLKSGLRAQSPVTAAIVDAGYGSASRVYESAAERLGMTPSQYRAGGAGVTLSWASRKTEMGPLLIAASDRGLAFVQFGDTVEALRAQLATEFPRATIEPMAEAARPQFDAWMRLIELALRGHAVSDALPLDLRGTAFQLKVWQALLAIPSGELRSYAQVASAIGAPRAVRAVAGACASNRIGVLVPCHRVIRGDGSLGGYRWGLERKRALIDAERSAPLR